MEYKPSEVGWAVLCAISILILFSFLFLITGIKRLAKV